MFYLDISKDGVYRPLLIDDKLMLFRQRSDASAYSMRFKEACEVGRILNWGD